MSNPNDLASDMTIRQRFVMAAMQGLCARNQGTVIRDAAEAAVLIADAALAEEARTRQP